MNFGEIFVRRSGPHCTVPVRTRHRGNGAAEVATVFLFFPSPLWAHARTHLCLYTVAESRCYSSTALKMAYCFDAAAVCRSNTWWISGRRRRLPRLRHAIDYVPESSGSSVVTRVTVHDKLVKRTRIPGSGPARLLQVNFFFFVENRAYAVLDFARFRRFPTF